MNYLFKAHFSVKIFITHIIRERFMNNEDKKLFQMGEVTKALGLTRRILINYEEHGLLTPAVKSKNRSFRYYSVDNMVHIRMIRSLQNIGLSLAEIRDYIDNTGNLNEKIHHLLLLRNQLDQYIAQLQLRQANTEAHTVYNVTLPAFTAYCKDFNGLDLAGKTTELRQTYIDAVKDYRVNSESKMYTEVSINDPDSGTFIIPVDSSSEGEYIHRFPAASAICIYYRGSYENFDKIHKLLLDYAKERGMTPQGTFRNIYMEGPPTHGANSDAYITQIAMPIKFVTL